MFKLRRSNLVYLDRSNMDPQLRRISYVVLTMFLVVMLAAGSIQVIFAEDLRSDPRNVRINYAAATVHRGAIIVGEDDVAYSYKSGKNYRRAYLKPEIYAPLTGYFSNTQGMNGLELALNSELSGDSGNQFLGQLQNSLLGTVKSGASVTLTINPKLQEAVWKALIDYHGAAVVMEPKTGRILAMVSKPSYDPNQLSNGDSESIRRYYKSLSDNPQKPLANRAISGDLYYPGSIFKLVTMAAALESGGYSLKGEIHNENRLTFPGRDFFIDNAPRCQYGENIDLEHALAFSCNATFGRIALELGGKAIKNMAGKFGFGREMGIPLPVARSWYTLTSDPAQLAQSSFGQWDVKVTPMEVAMITSAIANRGKLMKPNLVEKVQSANLATLSTFVPEVLSEPINPQVAGELSAAMESVIQYGTATGAKINGVRVAGKTGTAENGTGKHTLWFTGFAPVEDPSIVVSLVLEDQAGDAGSLAVPIAKKIMEAAIGRR